MIEGDFAVKVDRLREAAADSSHVAWTGQEGRESVLRGRG